MRFRMVDRILTWERRRTIRGIKTVSFEEYQLRDRLGVDPCLPESLITEALLQLGNWLVVLSSDYTQMGWVVQWGRARFEDRLRPGQHLHLEVRVRSWRDHGVLLDAGASDGQRQIAVVRRCLALPVALADYCDPEDLRVLFSEIHRPQDPQQRERTVCPA